MEKIRYYDIRSVTGKKVSINTENEEIEKSGATYFKKALVRVLGENGWGYCCISGFDPENEKQKKEAIEKAARLAKLTKVKADMADIPLGVPHSWEISAKEQENIPLEEKSASLLRLESAARLDGIISTSAGYSETYSDVIFEDCNGYEAKCSCCRTVFTVSSVAAKNGDMQMNYEQHGVCGALNIDEFIKQGEKCSKTALALLDAKLSPGGKMNAVLNPELAGVFAHEAVGHASEGDAIRDGVSVLAGKLGEKVGSSIVTIIDDPSLPFYGYEPFDAEGVAGKATELIKNGVVNKYMHSRETLAAVGIDTGDAGHARAESGAQPLVRMSNTYIKEGDASYEEILEDCKCGVLLIGSRGGQVDPGRGVFQFNAKYGYLVENGEETQMIKDVSLSGDILSVLHNINLCGKERKMSAGMCGKGQYVPVSDGAPYVSLNNATVGGAGK